ncbi:hypothetical protein HMPREF0281_00815 [Corynebacterium ammoniagenes DSM 20306]|uniref:Uncharacterized protein n=1 Tax=Corynebacterium ammoniagenes DSM 20306 TaxID=649754 RepID=A0ABP2IFI5_CORAM|nr:hypothetical protein HMPREF0281_00815 [Corynebacterium ammoniagenes DSM 20306]
MKHFRWIFRVDAMKLPYFSHGFDRRKWPKIAPAPKRKNSPAS